MNAITRLGFTYLAAAALLFVSLPAAARVVVHGTRQIFPSNQREITVRTENIGEHASLIQAWIDDGDKSAAPEDIKTPFVLRPAVYRIDGGKSQVMRILFTGADLPTDRESIYWLNVLDIPPSPDAEEGADRNYLQFSLRTRIKLIYRPVGLKDVRSAPQRLQWSIVPQGNGWALQASNPTPYYVHFSELGLKVQGVSYPANDVTMVAPMSSRTYTFKGLSTRPVSGNVQFEYLTDQGGVIAQSVPLAN